MTVAVAAAGGTAAATLALLARRAAALERVRALRPATDRVPRGVHARVGVALAAAAVEVEPAAALRLWLLAGVLGAALGLALVPALVVPGAVLGLVAPPVILHLARHRSQRRRAEALPVLLERVAAALRAGDTVEIALRGAAAGGPLAADVRTVQARVEWGAPLADALRAWAGSDDLTGVRAAAGALAIASTTGGAAADALEGLAGSLRDRLAVVAEARALATQARASAAVMVAVPFGHLAWTALTDPAAISELAGSPVGRLSLGAGALLDALGAWWMRRILRDRRA
jgi:tight adherence protein B